MKKVFDLFAQQPIPYTDSDYSHPNLTNNQLTKIKKRPNVKSSIDLHGLNRDDASLKLSSFLNRYPQNCVVEIIHGVGTEILQQSMRHYLKSHPRVYAFWPPTAHDKARLYCYLVSEKI